MAFGMSSGSFERIAPGVYRVKFDQGYNTSRYTVGLEKLAYEVFFCLFTTEGSIPDLPNFGTKLRTFIGQLAITADDGKVITAVTAEIMKAEAQVKNSQAGSDLAPSEKLKSLVVDQIALDLLNQSIDLRLVIVNELDQAVGFEIPNVGVTV